MFASAVSFNSDLNSWDVSGVTDMHAMFSQATHFKRDLCGVHWNVARDAFGGSTGSDGMFGFEVDKSHMFGGGGGAFKCCSPGSFYNPTTRDCTPCSGGTFQPEGDVLLTTCDSCGKGKAVPDRYAPRCVACLPGQFEETTRKDSRNSYGCKDCPKGWHGNDTSSTSCKACTAGRYENVTGSNATVCKACPRNTYSSGEAFALCFPCKNEAFTFEESGALECSVCPAGWRRVIASDPVKKAMSCTKCIPGRFREDKMSATICSECPAGYSQPQNGSQTCFPCLPGQFENTTGRSLCYNCPRGKFSKDSGATNCTDCDIGKFSDDPGSARCARCGAGTYGKVKGAGCEVCEPGRYRTGSMQATFCDACPKGYSQANNGTASCFPCLPGEFGNETEMSACHLCAAGRVSETAAKAYCSDCPKERRPTKKGSTSCTPCAAGTYEMKSTCADCPNGWHSPSLGALVCEVCKIGKTADPGSSRCTDCALGKFGDVPGHCNDCASGKYNDATMYARADGTLACQRCPVDTFNEGLGATSVGQCLKCDVEYHPHTTTSNATGVRSKMAGCVCAGAIAAGDGRGYFTANTSTDKLCEACPFGASCSRDGMRADSVMALPGHWRPPLHNPDNKFPSCAQGYKGEIAQTLAEERCCPGDTCQNITAAKLRANPDVQCSPGYSGVLCLVCADKYAKMGQDCHLCPTGKPDLGLAFAVVGVVCALVFFVVFLFLCAGSKAEARASEASGAFSQIKILISFVQIISALPNVMGGVPFPKIFVNFTLPFTSFNLDILGLLSGSACRLALGFHAQTIVHMSVLPMLATAVLAANLLVNVARKPKNDQEKAHRRAETSKLIILLTLFLCELSSSLVWHSPCCL